MVAFASRCAPLSDMLQSAAVPPGRTLTMALYHLPMRTGGPSCSRRSASCSTCSSSNLPVMNHMCHSRAYTATCMCTSLRERLMPFLQRSCIRPHVHLPTSTMRPAGTCCSS